MSIKVPTNFSDFGFSLFPSTDCSSCFDDGCMHYECESKINGKTYCVHISMDQESPLKYRVYAYHYEKDLLGNAEEITALFSKEDDAAYYLFKCFDFRCE